MSKRIMPLVYIIGAVTFLLFSVYFIAGKMRSDSIPPVITCLSDDIEMSIHDGNEILLSYVRATDNRDGDITDKVVIESISKFTDTEKATCVVTFAVCDSSNNLSRVSCDLHYTDYTPIRFTLTDSTRCKLSSNSNPLSFIRAYDCMEGDITRKIRYEANETKDFTVYSAGVYGVRYSVVNQMGDIEYLDVNIEVYTPTNVPTTFVPELYLKKYSEYLKVGDKFEPYSYIKSMLVDGEVYDYTSSHRKQFNIIGEVDTSKPGTYRVIYEFTPTDALYDVTTQAILYIIVE